MVKVQKSGNCYSVYLPNDWIKDNKIEKGSELEVQASRENLVLTAQSNERTVKKSVLTLATNNPEIIIKFIKAGYIAGNDDLEIKTSLLSDEALMKISRLVKNLNLNMIQVSKYGFHLKASTSIDDLPLFTWEFIYKIINIIRMAVTGERKEVINEQANSIYYNKLVIQRTVYRYQQLLTNQRIKPFEANLHLIMAINFNKIVHYLTQVKDKKYLNTLLTFMEKLLNVYNYTYLKPLTELMVELKELKNEDNALKNKTYRLLSEVISTLTEYYMAENA